MRKWILVLLPLLGGVGCDKPIHEARGPSVSPPIITLSPAQFQA